MAKSSWLRGIEVFASINEAPGESHVDPACGYIYGVQPGAHKRNQQWFRFGGVILREARGIDGEEGSGIFEASPPIRTGGEFDSTYDADGGIRVEDGAPDKVSYKEGIRVKHWKLMAGDQKMHSGEPLSVGDGVAPRELEDDTSGIVAGGEPVLLNLNARVAWSWALTAWRREKELTRGRKDFGKIGERLGQELTATTLRTKQVRHWNPIGCGDTMQ